MKLCFATPALLVQALSVICVGLQREYLPILSFSSILWILAFSQLFLFVLFSLRVLASVLMRSADTKCFRICIRVCILVSMIYDCNFFLFFFL